MNNYSLEKNQWICTFVEKSWRVVSHLTSINGFSFSTKNNLGLSFLFIKFIFSSFSECLTEILKLFTVLLDCFKLKLLTHFQIVPNEELSLLKFTVESRSVMGAVHKER